MKTFITIIIVISLLLTAVLVINSPKGTTSGTSDSPCIITIEGNKYDVSTLRGIHPGGDIYECGTDMTTTFIEQHGNDFQRIEKYRVRN